MMNRSFGNQSYTSATPRMSAPTVDWEDLRKQARQLENELETKLISFSKLCSNYVARDHSSHNYHGYDSPPTPTSASFETMSIEVEKLLERLSDVNKRMAEVVPTLHDPNNHATHTLKRHHEICQDCRREFDRTKANMRNFQSREDLLMNNNNNPDINPTSVNSRRQDYYSREAIQLNSSHRLLDDNIDSALRLKSSLLDGRRHLNSITGKVKSIANRFPLINNILYKTKLKKRKDSLILGGVIAVCLVLLLFYIFR